MPDVKNCSNFEAHGLRIFLNSSTGRVEKRVNGPSLAYDKYQC